MEANTDLEMAVLESVAVRQRALLERVTVLERALERISAIADNPTDNPVGDRINIASLAQAALDD